MLKDAWVRCQHSTDPFSLVPQCLVARLESPSLRGEDLGNKSPNRFTLILCTLQPRSVETELVYSEVQGWPTCWNLARAASHKPGTPFMRATMRLLVELGRELAGEGFLLAATASSFLRACRAVTPLLCSLAGGLAALISECVLPGPGG